MTYINPLLSNVSQRETPYRHNYYREALEEGFAVRNGDGTVWTGYSDSLLVDLSNPSAYQWMKNMIVNVCCIKPLTCTEAIPISHLIVCGS